ncbi:MAG: VOC family protein [Ktedonobacteraceae bacterium]|nr:VOC family protein [Ktedonobacteraceae bacterium]
MKLNTPVAIISVLVDNQDEALHFYTQKLGLEKRTDVTFGPGLRLLTVAPRGQQKPEIALATPDVKRMGEEHINALKARRSHRATPWIFDTDDCCQVYEMLKARGVSFVSEPVRQSYGLEAVFEDPYGNTFVLLEPAPEVRAWFERHYTGTAA